MNRVELALEPVDFDSKVRASTWAWSHSGVSWSRAEDQKAGKETQASQAERGIYHLARADSSQCFSSFLARGARRLGDCVSPHLRLILDCGFIL